MANPQKENGYTAIANEILDVLTRTNLQSSERRVLDVIFRKTYGFNKKEDSISISQIVEATNLGKRSVIYATQNLEAKHIISVTREGYDTNTYRFQKDYDQWDVQRNSEQYENMLKQKREKYKQGGGAEKRGVVQRNEESSAENTVKVVQRRTKKGRFSAHTKDKSNKAIQKTGNDTAPDEPVRVTDEQVKSAREIRDIIEAFSEINPAVKKMYGNTAQRQACADLVEAYTFERVIFVIANTLPRTNAQAFFPTITTPYQLFQDWARLEAAIKKWKSKSDIRSQEKGRGLA